MRINTDKLVVNGRLTAEAFYHIRKVARPRSNEDKQSIWSLVDICMTPEDAQDAIDELAHEDGTPCSIDEFLRAFVQAVTEKVNCLKN